MLPNLVPFGPIFGFVFVIAVSYAILMKTEIFGKDKFAVNMGISAMMGFFAVTSTVFLKLMNDIVPYVLIFITFLFFTILVFLFLGVKPDEIAKPFTDESEAITIITVIVCIFGGVIINHYYKGFSEIPFLKNSYILGLIAFFVIGFFTVKLLAYEVPYAPK